jgi:tRNA (mo5U34)-methyltransferase
MGLTERAVNISELASSAGGFRSEFEAAKSRAAAKDFPWYPYDSLSNFTWLDRLLTGTNRDFGKLVGKSPILDVGCADGATSFFLEKAGFDVDVLDYPPTNFNGMRALQALKPVLNSNIGIHAYSRLRAMFSNYDFNDRRP